MEWMQKRVRDWRERVRLPNGKLGKLDAIATVRAYERVVEEFHEWMDAETDEEDAKETADLLFTIFGYCCATGLDIEPVFRAVCDSNDTKVGHKDINGKVVKGESYVPPDIAGVLRAQGWEG